MDEVLAHLLRQHESLARMLRRTVENLTDDQFTRAPGDTAPPIGWHLWHIARWGDRFQATLVDRDAPPEIWTTERLAEVCGLDPEELGARPLSPN